MQSIVCSASVDKEETKKDCGGYTALITSSYNRQCPMHIIHRVQMWRYT